MNEGAYLAAVLYSDKAVVHISCVFIAHFICSVVGIRLQAHSSCLYEASTAALVEM